MEPILPILILLFIGVPLAVAVWLIVRAVRAKNQLTEFSQRLEDLEREIIRLKQQKESIQPAEPVPVPKPVAPIVPVMAPAEPKAPSPTSIPAAPGPISPLLRNPLPALPVTPAPKSTPKLKPAINWEQFMGVKMFAYLGGLAAFMGVALAIKYSFDHNLISPEIRMGIGFCIGLILLVAGLLIHRQKKYVVGAQTLCATGVVILYAIAFACHAIYKFSFFYPNPLPTFSLMIGITVVAFFLAIRLNALVVAILGILGGFLTPILISTGQDNPLGLFGYIAILDAGLLMVALRQRWHFLALLGAVGTLFLQVGWADKFFFAESYFAGNKIIMPLGWLLCFNALFVAFIAWAKRSRQLNVWYMASLVLLAFSAFAFAGWFLTFDLLAQRPLLIFGFVFLIDLGIAALACFDDRAVKLQLVAGLSVFGLLLFWTSHSLANNLLNAALVIYFIFAGFHSVFPVLLQRRGVIKQMPSTSQLFPLLALGLVLWPIFQLADMSFMVWPFFLLVDGLAIGLALVTLSLWPVLAVLGLTLVALGEYIFKIPVNLTGLTEFLCLLGAFSMLFVAVGMWLTHKFKPAAFAEGVKLNDTIAVPENLAAQLPIFSAALPFLLLIMAVLRLPATDPTPFFGLALILVLALLVVTRLFLLDWLPAISLTCVAALEYAWHGSHFTPSNALVSLLWYLSFLAIFTVFPFLFLKRFSRKIIPWAVSALAAIPQFLLSYHTIKTAWPNDVMGLLPAAFALLPLSGLAIIWKKNQIKDGARLAQLAWFGGLTLFFVTLIFPIQFEHQWITLGWALEGVALLWLFQRVPHSGLQRTGIGLLVIAFVRLALNSAVLSYHTRSALPIFNWYLYTYGITACCFFTGARLLAPPRHQIAKLSLPPWLVSLGTVLVFLLLNIEIADYFSEPGSALVFEFSGNTPRDMVYSIAWGLFALMLLVIGIWKKVPASRYASLGLLSVTLLKLFLHDLSHLPQLYRIGAFVGVAVIALLASFAYQKFFAVNDPAESPNTTLPSDDFSKSARDKEPGSV
ncbi:MAG TPA: DUF2339 domain-containing protein [Verrucomicrobiae bacterium]|jgi:hypothetical protein